MLGRRAEDPHPRHRRLQRQRDVVRRLPAKSENRTSRLLELVDAQHRLERELLEVEPVADVIVGGDRLRIAIDHHGRVLESLQLLDASDAAGVELHRGTDSVDARAEHDHRLRVRLKLRDYWLAIKTGCSCTFPTSTSSSSPLYVRYR